MSFFRKLGKKISSGVSKLGKSVSTGTDKLGKVSAKVAGAVDKGFDIAGKGYNAIKKIPVVGGIVEGLENTNIGQDIKLGVNGFRNLVKMGNDAIQQTKNLKDKVKNTDWKNNKDIKNISVEAKNILKNVTNNPSNEVENMAEQM